MKKIFSRKDAKSTKCLFLMTYKFYFATFAILREIKMIFYTGLQLLKESHEFTAIFTATDKTLIQI